jgi:phospholipase C
MAPALPAKESTARVQIHHRSSSPITHVIIMVQENRSFDNLFATYPGADGTTTGVTHTGKVINLHVGHLAAFDISHQHQDYLVDYDGGKMDGFDLSHIGQAPAGQYPYQYVDPKDIVPYWTVASHYVLADHMFQTQGSGSFTAHQDLIAGGTTLYSLGASIIDTPSSNSSWGCDAAKGTVTSLLTFNGQYLGGQGPFPCLSYSTGTMADALDARSVSWKYYVPPHRNNTVGALWNAFDAIRKVRYGPEWTTNVITPQTAIFSDIASGKLPAVSWLIPDHPDSDHPRSRNENDYHGPSWVAAVVNAVGESAYWNSTAIVVVWDDWGGFYDHVPPPFIDQLGGLGFRVPALVISAYEPSGYVDHTPYEFGSILKFVEQTFSLRSLGVSDARATSIGGMFDFSKPPRAFVPIGAPLSRAYFLKHPPSYEPLDSE